MAHRTLHYWGEGYCRYGAPDRVQGTFNVKELKELYALKANDEEAFDDALEDVDDYFTTMSLMEDLSEEDFLKVVNGESGFVWAEEIVFGIGGTLTKAKLGYAERDLG